MNQIAEKYLSTLDRSPNTIKTYRQALTRYLSFSKDRMDDEIYESFLSSLRNLSPSTKRVCTSAVMGLFDFAEVGSLEHRRKLNRHYMRKVKSKPVVFDRDKVEKIIKYCDGLRGDLMELRDRAFVLTLAGTGFRISELCSLKRGDVDWQDERVIITGKGDKTATVRMTHRCITALKDYLSARAKMDGDSGKPLASLPLFAHHDKTRRVKAMGISGMWSAIKARMREAGADVRIHDFRHYFVTMVMITSGGNLKLAKELARHESVLTTQRYAHFAETELDQQFDEIFNR